MKQFVLAAIAVLSIGVGLAFAADPDAAPGAALGPGLQQRRSRVTDVSGK